MKKILALSVLFFFLATNICFAGMTAIPTPAIGSTTLFNFHAPLSGNLTDLAQGKAGSHVRASSATYTDTTTGLITTVAANIPRYETVGGIKALLIEPAGTNLCTHSHEFDNAAWTKNNCTISANATDAPDGNTVADKIVEATDVGQVHDIQDDFVAADFTDDASVTFSVYVKKAERGWVKLSLRNKANAWVGAYFDLTNGVIGTEGVDSYAITSAANGFYRCSITHDIANGATNPHFNIAVASADNTDTYNGDGASGIYVWGAQVEEFPLPTTYIATSGATATRATESGYPLWNLPLGLFDAEGTCSVWVRFAYNRGDHDDSRRGLLAVSNVARSLLFTNMSSSTSNPTTYDGTTDGFVALNYLKNTWYKFVIKWSSATSKMRIGYDSGAGIVWGAEVVFDGSYTLGASLRLAYGLYGPMWFWELTIDDSVWTDYKINNWIGSP